MEKFCIVIELNVEGKKMEKFCIVILQFENQ